MLANIIRMGVGKIRRLIDRKPTVVVNQLLSLLGNGGRKLVRLDNGWLVSAMLASDGWSLYLSKDFGQTWGLLYIRRVFSPDITISSIGNNKVMVLVYHFDELRYYNINCSNGILEGYGIVANNVTQMGNISIQTNKDKTEIHMCWSSKNTSMINNFNIKYRKFVINENGEFLLKPTRIVTESTANGVSNDSPTIVVSENKTIIIFEYHNVSYHRIMCAVHDSIDDKRGVRNVYIGDPYPQSSPSSCVDTDGVILATWHGADTSHPTISHIRFSKSLNGGTTWESMKKLASGINPSITTDKNGIYYIEYQSGTYSWIIQSSDKGETWSSPVAIVISSNPNTLYDNTFKLDFEFPLSIRQTSNSVIFSGKWYE